MVNSPPKKDMVQQKMKHLAKRQDLIMHGLDTVHRSLLINNINYENGESIYRLNSPTLSDEDIGNLSNLKSEQCLPVAKIQENSYRTKPAMKTTRRITINITAMNSPNLNEKISEDVENNEQLTSAKNVLLPLEINTDCNNVVMEDNTKSSIGTSTSNSSSNSGSYDFYDYSSNEGSTSNLSSNEQNDSLYSSSERTTTTTTKSTIKSYKKSSKKNKISAPMLEIVQELADTCEVKSTVRVNRGKVRQWNNKKSPVNEQSNHHDRNTQSKRKKYTQKIINDNYCNEILDQTINKVNENMETHPIVESSDVNTTNLLNRSIDSSIKYGKLVANSKSKTAPVNKIGGKLLATRMQRHSIDNCRLNSLVNNNKKLLTEELPIKLDKNQKNIIISKIPPKKPPRLFTSNSSSSSTAGDCCGGGGGGGGVINSATTVAVEDLIQISPTQIPKKLNASRKLGWNIEELTKPSCPNFDDIVMENNKSPIKLGWAPTRQLEIPENILKMLHYDDRQSTEKHNIKTLKLKPEPQVLHPQLQKPLQSSPLTTNKENIDEVDGPSLPPRSESRKSKNIERFATTVYSTPKKMPTTSVEYSQANVENVEYCKNCHEKIITEPSHLSSSVRKSFGKAALKKTKTFLEASKNILTRPTSKQVNVCDEPNDNDVDHSPLNYVDIEFQTPEKSEITAQFNQDSFQRYSEKKTMKTLGFTPPQKQLPASPSNKNHIVCSTSATKKSESPKKIMEKFLSSVKRTPPKKPIRKSLLTTEKTQEIFHKNNFDFQRTVNSPKTHKDCFSQPLRHSLNLSPKCLFKQQQQSPKQLPPQYETYKSFPDTVDDGFIIYMGEYLRQMSLKIEENNKQQETISTAGYHQQNIPIGLLKNQENEPIYAEIESINNREFPIYAKVNKSQKLKRSKSLTALPPMNMETIEKNQSYESIIEFDDQKTDLVASIENFLEKQKQNDSVQHRVVVVADVIDENQRVEKINESLQQKSAPSITKITTTPIESVDAIEMLNSNSDNDSIVLTSSLYEEVVKGESINDEIISAINHLETIEYDKYQQEIPVPVNQFNFDRIDSIDDDLYNSPEYDTPQIKLFETMENQPPSPTNKSTTKLSKYFPTKRNPPTYKQIKHSIRNSIRRSSMFFKTPNNKSSISSPLVSQKQQQQQQQPHQLEQKHSLRISTPSGRRDYTSSASMVELSDSYMLKLTNQITHQQEIRQQLRNAIDVCRNSDGLRHSIELVEAERLMLLSQKKESSAKEELIRIDYDEEGLTENLNLTGMASVQLRRIEFEFDSAAASFKLNDQENKYFFICLCSYRDQVMASSPKTFPLSSTTATSGQHHVCKNKIIFDNLGIRFVELNPLFIIKIEIFMLKICLQSGKLKSTTSLSSSTTSTTGDQNHIVNIEPSRFRLHAQLQITLNDLWSMKNQSKPICNRFSSSGVTFSCSNQIKIDEIGQSVHGSIPSQSTAATTAPMMNTCSLDVYSEIHLDMPNVNGFLMLNDTVTGNVISRHWCWINGCYLNMSRKPNDDLTKPPQESVLSIDLTTCMNESIEIDNSQHPNIFTIVVYNKNRSQSSNNEHQILKYIFSCGRNGGDADLKIWVHQINRILLFIRNWNL